MGQTPAAFRLECPSGSVSSSQKPDAGQNLAAPWSGRSADQASSRPRGKRQVGLGFQRRPVRSRGRRSRAGRCRLQRRWHERAGPRRGGSRCGGVRVAGSSPVPDAPPDHRSASRRRPDPTGSSSVVKRSSSSAISCPVLMHLRQPGAVRRSGPGVRTTRAPVVTIDEDRHSRTCRNMPEPGRPATCGQAEPSIQPGGLRRADHELCAAAAQPQSAAVRAKRIAGTAGAG